MRRQLRKTARTSPGCALVAMSKSLGVVAEQHVADAAADEVGLVADVPQSRDDPDGVRVEPVLRDLRRV